jgi:hypothetical protein
MHQRLLDRFEGLWQLATKKLGIGLVGDDHVFPIDEAIGAGRIARSGQRHRRQFQNVIFAHEPVTPH